jgi:arylsulfatase A-like enzyme
MWPSYSRVTEPDEAIGQLKRNYMANLTYLDACLGKLIDTFDELDMWKDTLIVFTTDHGLMLGEHDYTGKNIMPQYNEISHIPLMVHLPGDRHAGRRIGALTQNIDLYPTILELNNIAFDHKIHGKSWGPLLEGKTDKLRECIIHGVFGEDVNLTDGRFTYFRTHCNEENQPLYSYTATPSTNKRYWDEKYFGDIEVGRMLKYTKHPVFKVPVYDIWLNERYLEYCNENMLFDIEADYAQLNNLAGGELEQKYRDLLIKKMKEVGAPQEQYIRLGLE